MTTKNPKDVKGTKSCDDPHDINPELKEYHCCNCGRFLCFQAIVEGTIAIKCRRCKEMNVLDITQEIDTGIDKCS
jgi:phage FluMu protein Com